MLNRILISVIIGMATFTFSGCFDKPKLDIEPIIKAVSDKAVSIGNAIHGFDMTEAEATAIRDAIHSCYKVETIEGKTRAQTLVISLYNCLQEKVDDGSVHKSHANIMRVMLDPMIIYLETVSTKHPEWDMSKLESALFENI